MCLDNRHLIYAAGIFLLVMMLGAAVLMWPAHRQIKSMRQEIVALNEKVRDMSTLKTRVSILESKLANAQQTIDHDLKVIPETSNIAELMRRLSLPVDSNTVFEQTFTAGTSRSALSDEDATVRLMPLTVEMEGTFDAAFAVMQAAESMDRLVRVNSIRLNCDREKATEDRRPYVLASIGFEAVYDPGEHED